MAIFSKIVSMTIINQDLPFMPYKQKHKIYARENRAEPTYTENIVWKSILQERPLGYKFTRQKPIWPYIADFYCSKLKLVIEIDGESHLENIEYDERRDSDMRKLWIMTIRYTNDEVAWNGNKVFDDICVRIKERERELGF